VFSRCDGNLDNCLWDGQRIVAVDYEKSGWRDRAFDLADAIELDRAWALNDGFPGTYEDDWSWFTDQFDLSNAERTRLLAARRALALFWLLRLCRTPSGAVERAKLIAADRLAARLEEVRRL
jgi:thiamine kinase-like enzyme